MRVRPRSIGLLVGIAAVSACSRGQTTIDGFGSAAQRLRIVNTTAIKLEDRNGVRLSPAAGSAVAWVEGSDFQSGTIEVDVRGREWMSQKFVGVAFHRKDDNTYEAVYVRPFNFRTSDRTRRQHAVQYITLPDFDYDRLRRDFPEEFENPVDASIEPALEVPKLGLLYGVQVGLWVGNDSGGDFANLVITPTK